MTTFGNFYIDPTFSRTILVLPSLLLLLVEVAALFNALSTSAGVFVVFLER